MFPNFPTKKYDIIYLDPPYQYDPPTLKEYRSWAPETKYSTLSLEELKQLPIDSISHSDTILFMWVTNKYLLDAKELLESWNFKYRDVAFIWEKLYKNGNPVMGMGWITRRNCELCLIAYRDNRKVKIVHARQKTDVQQLVRAPKREHSRKPDIFRKLICDLFRGENKIELFARKYPDSEYFDGWDVWGYESQSLLPRQVKTRAKKRKIENEKMAKSVPEITLLSTRLSFPPDLM